MQWKLNRLDSWVILELVPVKEISLYDGEFKDRRK